MIKNSWASVGLGDNNKPVFSGGIVTASLEYDLLDGDASNGRNFRVEGKNTVTRPGHNNATISPINDKIIMMTVQYPNFVPSDSSFSYLIISDKFNFYQLPSTLTSFPVAITLPNTLVGTLSNTVKRRNFFHFQTDIYVTDGESNYGYIHDGNQYIQVPNTNLPRPVTTPNGAIDTKGGPFQPLVGTMWGNRALVGGGLTHPYSIYESLTNEPHNFIFTSTISNLVYDLLGNPVLNPDGTQATVDTIIETTKRYDFDSAIVAIYSSQESCYVWTKRSVYIANGNRDSAGGLVWKKLQANEGCISQASVTSANNRVMWITPSFRIMQTGFLNGQFTENVVELSHRPNNGIGDFLDKIKINCYPIDSNFESNINDIWGYYLEDKGLIKYYFHNPDQLSNIYNEIAIIYDTKRDQFYIDDNQHFFCGTHWYGKNYVAEHNSAGICQDEVIQTINDTSLSRGTVPIHFWRASKIWTNGSVLIPKILTGAMTEVVLKGTIGSFHQTIYADGEKIHHREITDAVKNTTYTDFDGNIISPSGSERNLQEGTGGSTWSDPDGFTGGNPYDYTEGLSNELTGQFGILPRARANTATLEIERSQTGIIAKEGELGQRYHGIQVVWEHKALDTRVILENFDFKYTMLSEESATPTQGSYGN